MNSRAVVSVDPNCFLRQTTRSSETELSEQNTGLQTDLSRHLETNFNLISKLLQADTISNGSIRSSKFIISERGKSINLLKPTCYLLHQQFEIQ